VNPEEATFLAWWRRLALVGGVVSLILGLILLIWPRETLLVVAVLLGLWLIISGVIRLVQSILTPDTGFRSEAAVGQERDLGPGRSGGARVLHALGGLLLLGIGIVCLRNLSNSLALLAALIGVAWILVGVIELWAAFSGTSAGGSRVGQVVIGLVTVVGGLVVLLWPDITLVVLVWLTGLWLLVLGLIQLILTWRVGKAVAGSPRPT
jgi:uncharacterized membrane protein HdeD (DUF308 family)